MSRTRSPARTRRCATSRGGSFAGKYVAQADEIQQPRNRAALVDAHPQRRPPFALEALAQLDDRPQSRGVHERDVGEVDDERATVLGRGVEGRGELVRVDEVDLSA